MKILWRFLVLLLACVTAHAKDIAPAFEDTLAQRLLLCASCHGEQGRAGPGGYYPRIAGKPAAYLYNQLKNFQTGQRSHDLMARLVEPLSDDYLRAIAQHFASLDLPHAAPLPVKEQALTLARGEQLALRGDPQRKLAACASCHGAALTGALPATPGLLGLPRDYVNAQLGAWQTGSRHAAAPDCMAQVAKALEPADVVAVSAWLASRPVPAKSPLTALPQPAPLECGSFQTSTITSPTPIAVAPAVAAAAVKDPSSATERGRYLALLGNCQACHTQRGGVPYAGGRAIPTPFGTVYSTNLTPSASGLQAWTADDFWRALHHGQSRDGRLLNPAFPYTNFTHITRADSDALYLYLRSLAPTSTTAKPDTLRWPFNTQLALKVWQLLYFKVASTATEPERGAYLVQGLGHCSTCHLPRNAMGGNFNMQDLSGGRIPVQNWFAPSLFDPLQAGVQDGSVDDIVRLFQSGSARKGVVAGPMAEVVQHSTQHWTSDDLRAMALYLKALPRTASTPANAAPARPERALASGAKKYETYCAQCHGLRGEGHRDERGHWAYPALAGNRAVLQKLSDNAIQSVLYGGFGPTTHATPQPFGMPPFVLQLNDEAIADVLTYIRSAWGNRAEPVTALQVQTLRDALTAK